MPSVLARLETLLNDVTRGGMTVDTPLGDPVLRTVIQFDGDVQTLIRAAEFDSLAEPSALLPGLMAQNQTAVAQRVDSVRGLRIWGTVLRYGAWTVSAAMSVATLHAAWLGGAEEILTDLGLAVVPVVSRLALPRLLRLSLHAAAQRLAADLHEESERQITHLTGRRAARTAPGTRPAG
jgi:hypothetical protein